jgi:hypothetical protein
MPIVAMVAIDLLDMAVLRLTLAPSQHHSAVGQEHGRTIPLADIGLQKGLNDQCHDLVAVVAPREGRARLSNVCRDRERKRPGNRQFHATPLVVARNNRRFAQMQCKSREGRFGHHRVGFAWEAQYRNPGLRVSGYVNDLGTLLRQQNVT